MPDHALRVAGAGLLALDVIISEPGCPDALTFAGGTCGNVLSILSFLRWTATPIGFIGDDLAGKRVLADLATAGVQSAHLIQQPQCSTPIFIQRLEHDGSNRPKHSFADATNCPRCGQALTGDLPTKVGITPIRKFTAPEQIDVFFMDRLSDDILSLAESAHARGALVFYEPSAKEDMAFWQEDAFNLVDIVKYSADRFTTDELAPFLTRRSRCPLWEVQTKGARGLRYRKHGMHSIGTARWTMSAAIPATRVVDTCGAGDWCSAGLLHGLLTFRKRRDSVSFANAVRFGQLLAAWACAFVGARGAMYCNDRQTTWSAIKSLVEGREMDLSRLPFATQSRPPISSDPSSCIAHLHEG